MWVYTQCTSVFRQNYLIKVSNHWWFCLKCLQLYASPHELQLIKLEFELNYTKSDSRLRCFISSSIVVSIWVTVIGSLSSRRCLLEISEEERYPIAIYYEAARLPFRSISRPLS
ncbi:hypothetical protein CEXT_272351 [Caerostris extrusa]|uniref:Uncharacterized protein n=1 Tax=Caerostris extrusa TaxID=172846 RepID=A0AAV4SVM3_CAEEX|nr:hypothetical protein CEXT_272351 [Caerostris extrusa]